MKPGFQYLICGFGCFVILTAQIMAIEGDHWILGTLAAMVAWFAWRFLIFGHLPEFKDFVRSSKPFFFLLFCACACGAEPIKIEYLETSTNVFRGWIDSDGGVGVMRGDNLQIRDIGVSNMTETVVLQTNVVERDNHKDPRDWIDNYAFYSTDPHAHEHHDPYQPPTELWKDYAVTRQFTLRFRWRGDDQTLTRTEAVTNWTEHFEMWWREVKTNSVYSGASINKRGELQFQFWRQDNDGKGYSLIGTTTNWPTNITNK